MNYIELINILSKPWADVKDIMKIGSYGRYGAYKVLDDIENVIYKSGHKVPITNKRIVPMEKVIEYFNLDYDYIFNMAKKTKELNLC